LDNFGWDPFKLFGVNPSIRKRLIISFCFAILVPSLLTAMVGIHMIKKHVYKEAQSKVNSDLEYAKEIYGSNTTRIKDALRIHATRKIIYGALSGGDDSELGAELERIWLEEKFDFLTLTDTEGNIFYSTSRRGRMDHSYKDNDFVRYVIYHRQPMAGSALIPLSELEAESPSLKEQAFMEITPTPKARKDNQKFLKEGLVIAGAAPVFTPQKKFVGVLYGGNLLNRNYEIVDKIRSTIFEGGSLYKGKPTGTVTILQADVRISTNVLNTDGSRAISTRVSAEVADAVLSRNETFSGKAFVVNDWYLSSYTPIKNAENGTIGILYVGVLERPYKDSLLQSLQIFLGLVVFGVLFVGYLSLRIAERISAPISRLAEAAKRVGEGDYEMKVDLGERNDEIGRFARDFNNMVKEIRESHLAMTTWTEVLEEKVEERTKALKSIQDQLVQTEKLAGIGRLAAGVAHEINNPLTGILTNSSLMLEDLPDEDPRKDDLKVIVDETLRCRKIVKGLLDFARQSPPQKQLVSLNGVIEDVITLVRNQANFRNIKISLQLDGTIPQIYADRDQIRQVVLNIVLNAADAMPGGGEFHIRSSGYADDGFIELSFRDTGEGIPRDVQEKLFEPFVTTKKSGTGLGLSIAYGIIERHKGKIAVDSTPGKGTTFRIILPVKQNEE